MEANVCVDIQKDSADRLRLRKYGPEKEWLLYHEKDDLYSTEDDRTVRLRVKGRVIWPRSTAQSVMETVTDQLTKVVRGAID